MENMLHKNLVDVLAQLNPVLFATYKKTEEVAVNHWYPGISQSNGSINSYPHVQGIIHQLSIVVYHPLCAITLTDVELYLLLTGILLHDIGKVQQKKNHGEVSRNLIKKHWADLKIENEQMEQIIQNICLLHDRTETQFESVYQQLPADEYIDRYGKVRPRLLGALLYLGDHMDNSYTRTLPEEFTNHFRKNVLGVHFQPEQQLITTAIDPGAFMQSRPEKDVILYCSKLVEDSAGVLGSYLEAEAMSSTGDSSPKQHVDLEALLYLMQDTYENDNCLSNIWNELYMLGMPIKKWMIECKGQLFLVQRHDRHRVGWSLDRALLDRFASAPEGGANPKWSKDDSLWLKNELDSLQKRADAQSIDDSTYLAAACRIVLDIKKKISSRSGVKEIAPERQRADQNAKDLQAVCDLPQLCPLSPMKIEDGGERKTLMTPYFHTALSIEPLTGLDYCMKVLVAMYDMTSRIFAKSFYTYTDICNYMREDPKNTKKVMSAVRRLSYLFQYIGKNIKPAASCRYEIYYNDQVWNISNAADGNETERRVSDKAGHGREIEIHEKPKWICYIKPEPNEEPQAVLESVRDLHVIADWTEEVRHNGSTVNE